MSKLTNGTSGQIVDTIGSDSLDVTGALTLLAVIKFATAASWASIIETETGAGGVRVTMIRSAGGPIRFGDESDWAETAMTIGTGDGWMIVAVTKATGSATPDGHKMPIGGSRTTQAMGLAIGSGNSAAGVVRLGGNDDWANAYFAAAAIFDKVLTTGELDGILSAKTTASINALSPIWLADDGNDFSNEYVSDRALTLSGTSDSADDPSGWVYGLGGAPGPSQRFMWMP